MKLPRSLIIGEELWKTKFVKHIAPKDKQGRTTLGFCDSETQTLEIKTRQPLEERVTTFCHELIHAFEDVYGFQLQHDDVEKLAYAAMRLLIDNWL